MVAGSFDLDVFTLRRELPLQWLSVWIRKETGKHKILRLRHPAPAPPSEHHARRGPAITPATATAALAGDPDGNAREPSSAQDAKGNGFNINFHRSRWPRDHETSEEHLLRTVTPSTSATVASPSLFDLRSKASASWRNVRDCGSPAPQGKVCTNAAVRLRTEG